MENNLIENESETLRQNVSNISQKTETWRSEVTSQNMKEGH